MNAENKKEIIDNLFDNQFNINNFKEFVNTVLNVKIDIDSEYKYVGIHKVFMNYIENYYIVSNYKDNEKNNILIMVVKIKDSIDDPVRARVKQREFIARHLRDKEKNGALVVFYNDKSKNWRISFIRLNYEFTSKGIEEKITPAKRLSYVVGEGEASKTVKDQFFTLANIEESVSLEQLEGLFALEKVTNEFFKEYKNKYLDIKETLIKDENFVKEALKHDIENPESFIEGFSKKLMGQIAFIYFLQKKGWLGIEVVPESLTFEEYNRIYERALDIEKEVLNKVYFREKKELYTLNKEELSKLDNKNESELLVGAFHNTEYFKEWGSGKKKFLRELFEKHKNEDKNNEKTFFEDYLEPLFYNNFSEDRGEKQYSAEFNSRLPFLNGGLFEPYGDYNWKKTKFNLDDSLFSNDKDNGILDIFDRYNFTINENDNYETEVAVDPEMLGKVFENLLEVSDRKSKGAFYTPREIVRYMTNESIMNYLLTHLEEKGISKEDLEYLFNLGEFTKEYDEQIFEKDYLKDEEELKKGIFGMPRNIIIYSKEIDELLRKVKIADPACGSGAFPLGILNEIVRARNILTFYINMIEVLKEKDEKNYWSRLDKKQKSRTPYKLKLYAIQNSLYGVDIEPSAIDITKLRLWLSILVDSTNNDVRPLPNLDFNFMIGNSLIDEFEGMKLFDESLLDDKVLEKKVKETEKVKYNKLFQGFEDKQQNILKEIFTKQSLFFNENNSHKKKELKNDIESLENNLIELTLNESGNHKKLEEIEKGRKERRKPYFLWKLEFAKVFKENGGFDIIIGNPPYVQIKFLKDKKNYEEMNYQVFSKSGDLYCLFFELGIELIKKDGNLNLITSNKWLRSSYGAKLRNYLLNYSKIKFLDLGARIFETATVDTAITFIIKNISNNKLYFGKKYSGKDLFLNNYLKIDLLKDEIWEVYDDNLNKIKYKIEKQKKLLDYGVELYYGILTGANKVFILDENKKDELLKLDSEIKNFINPILRGKDIEKYKANFQGYYLLNLHNGVPNKSNPVILDKESKLYKYLESYGEEFINRGEKGKNWYNLRSCNYIDIYEKVKIIYSDIVQNSGKFYLDLENYYTNDTAFLIYHQDIEFLKYLVGILNTDLVHRIYLLYYSGGKLGDKGLRYKKEFISKIPIPNKNKLIVKLVEEIIELKKLNKDTQDLENQIDEMVYSLYGLTEEEKELVRNFK